MGSKRYYSVFYKGLISSLLIVCAGFLNVQNAAATHIMGAELTWECQGGGDYVFELIFYRDCNGFEVNTTSENIRVWGHPDVNDITVDFIERIDISPTCTPSGGSTALDCGTGAEAGNGAGAVEKVIYRSNPITLNGTPPADGWAFTYENFSRNGALTNVTNPLTHGMTIAAYMFPIPGATPGECLDNSPQFLQEPYVVSCLGDVYLYNPHAVDQDLDSLVFDWAAPLDEFPTGTFDPPVNPAPISFEAGFAFDNPTPDASFDPGNQAAQIDSDNGSITFNSNTQGNFATKIKVDAYRDGIRIATVERETQLIVLNCGGGNNTPVVTAPFAGGTSFETTIDAGDFITFDIQSSDPENLQDGSPQSNFITASGLPFGTNFTNNAAGCDVGPCATLDATPPITGVQGASTTFSWQTSCDHLLDRNGNQLSEVPYTFVFKVQDDYCQVPKTRYETVTITLKNKEMLPPTEIDCIAVDENDDVTINWTQITDPNGVFEGYEIHRIGDGVVGVVADINTTSFTIPGDGVAQQDYTVAVLSGCDGGGRSYSDTVSNIFLELNNPGNGEALLNWNDPIDPPMNHFGSYYHIYSEYPAGNWTLIDSVPYGQTTYRDTITICEGFINYRVELPTSRCDFVSNIEGDTFEDNIVPDIPEIFSADIDLTSGDVTVTWDENGQEDTYGYVVYTLDANGFLVELDTVWGIGNTSYTHSPNTDEGPLEYSVAAFDSCFTDITPPTYQTSAKAPVHVTNFLEAEIDVCTRQILMNWTGYEGFQSLGDYEIRGRKNGGPWESFGTTNGNSFNLDIEFGDAYLFSILATDEATGATSFSNIVSVDFVEAGGPSYSYLSVASVEGDGIEIIHRMSLDGGVERVELERYNRFDDVFEKIDELPATSEELVFYDEDVEVNRRSYRYRTVMIDTCAQVLGISNLGETIFASTITDDAPMTHTISWSPYQEFVGNIVEYRIYRAVNGVFDPDPIGTTSPNVYSYTDSVAGLIDEQDGKICYYISAIEGFNELGIRERSRSNIVCPVIEPLIFVPNAFSVGGLNPIFKPETRMHRINDYSFAIFDRFGRTIFETNDPEEGWNGRIKESNEVAREGVYVYRLSLRNGDGIEVLKHGHLTLLDYRE